MSHGRKSGLESGLVKSSMSV